MNLSLRSIRKNIAALSVVALIASLLVMTGVANAANPSAVYDDVPSDAWYYDDLSWGMDTALFDTDKTSFYPGMEANRAEALKTLMVLEGTPVDTCDASIFPDVGADDWFCPFTTAAANAGFVSGMGAGHEYEGHFLPAQSVGRAEMAKMTMETLSLSSGHMLASSVFDDAVAGEWYDTYLGDAAYHCIFQGVGGTADVNPGGSLVRAELAGVTHRAALAADPATAEVCSGPIISSGALTVSIDGSTPDADFIPKNGANIVYSVFEFAASSDEDIMIDELVLSREGLGLPADFDAVKLYVDGVQLGSEKTVNTSENTSTFGSLGLVVPAGSSVLVEVRADMDAGATVENSQNAFCISAPEDVLADGVSSASSVEVGGSFKVCGEEMTTTSAEVGTITYEISTEDGEATIGDADVYVAELELDVDNTEDVEVTRVTFKQRGSADPEHFANMYLKEGTSVIADSSMASWEGDFLTFDLSEDPLYIERGNIERLKLYVDVVGGLNQTVEFDIYRDWHIEATGLVYEYGVNIEEVAAPPALNDIDIVGGNLAFSLSANNPTVGDVAPGSEEHEFMYFNIATGGDGVNMIGFDLDLNYDYTVPAVAIDNTDVDSLRVYERQADDTWRSRCGPLDPVAGAAAVVTLECRDSFEIAAGETIEFMVVLDVVNDAPEGAFYWVELDTATTDAEYLADGDSVDAADISGGVLQGKDQTVNAPTLTYTVASAPDDQDIVGGTQELDLIAWDFAASSADDITLTGLGVTCNYTDTTADGDECRDVFSNFKLYVKEGSTLTALHTGFETAPTGNPSVIDFNTIDLVIPAGSTAKLLLRANTSTGGDATDTVDFNIAANTAIDAEDSNNDLAAAQKVDASAALARTLTFVGNGTLTASVHADTPLSDIILDGEMGIEVAQLKFEANDREAIEITDLRLTQDDDAVTGCNATAADSIAADVHISDGTLSYDGTLSGGEVEFTGLDFVVPRDGELDLSITLDTNEISGSGADSGNCASLILEDLDGDYVDYETDGVDIKAVGVSSGEGLDDAALLGGSGYLAGAATDVYDVGTDDGINEFTLRNNIPTVTLTDQTPSIYGGDKTPSANQALFMFEVAVEGDGTAELDGLTFNVGASGSCGAPALTLYEVGNPTAIATDGGDDIFDENVPAAQDEFTGTNGIRVAGGASKEYMVRGDTITAGCGAAAGAVSVDLIDFQWDDGEFGMGIPTTGVDFVPVYGTGVSFPG